MNRLSYRKGLIALIFMIVAIAPFVVYHHAADAATTPSITTNKSVYFPGVIGENSSSDRAIAIFEDRILISVRDGDSNTASGTVDTVTLTITSAVGSGSVTKTLNESDTNTSIFTDTEGVKFVTSSLTQSGGGYGSNAALLISRPSDTVTLSLINVSGSTGTKTVDARSNTGSFTGTSSSILATTTTGASNARIVLTDPDLNRVSGTAETFPVRLSSQFVGGAITVTLTETGANTGVFSRTGRIVSSTGLSSEVDDCSLTQPTGTGTTDTTCGTSDFFLLRARAAGDTITVAYSTAASNDNASIAANTDITSEFTSAATSQTIAYGLGTQGTIELSGTIFTRGNRVTVTITDPDLNTSSSSINSFTQNATSIEVDGNVYVKTGDTLLIGINTHTETGLNTGIFTGSFTFGSATSDTFDNATGSVADRIIGTTPGIFTVFYDDSNPGSTAAGIVSASFQYLTATGTLALTPSTFQAGATMTITITDSDLNTSDVSINTVTDSTLGLADGVTGVGVLASETGMSITFINVSGTTTTVSAATTSDPGPPLTETGTSTGIFTGTFIVNFPTSVSSGTVTATYKDIPNSAGVTTTTTATSSVGQTPGVLTVNATQFNLTGVATLTLTDPDLNTSSTSSQSTTAVVASNVSQPTITTQTLFMKETAVDTGVLTGTLGFTTGTGRVGSTSLGALLQVLPGNTLRVRYTDSAPSGTSDVSLQVQSNTGTITMDDTIIQNQSSVTVTVSDPDLNSSASTAQTTTVEVNSTSSIGTPITVTLTETAIDSGSFNGTYATIGDSTADTNTTITAADTNTLTRQIAVSNTDGVTATYSDQQDAAGSVRSVTVSRVVRFTDGAMQILTQAGEALTDNQASAGDTVLIRYTDPDENTNATLVQSRTGAFFSTTDLTGISVIMFETGASTGIFEKAIVLSSTTSAASASLKVSTGDTITARFTDTTPSNTVQGVTSDGVARTATATIVTPGAPVLEPETATIGVGETTQLTATGVGPFTFSSSDTAVASVDSAGLVTGNAVGTATITVRSTTTNLTDTSTITVLTEAVTTGAPGSNDFDGDGAVTATDALNVLNAFATASALTSAQIASSDTNGDGRLNSTDALAILLQVAREAAAAAGEEAAAKVKASVAKAQEVGAVVISASSTSAVAGTTGVSVSVSPDVAIPRLGSVSMTITYDTSVLTVTAATAPTGFSGAPDISTAGTIRVGLAAFPGVDIAAGGSIVDITFDVASTAPSGDTTIAVALDALDQAPAEATGEITNLLPNATAQAGTISVTQPIPPLVLPNFSTENFFSFLFLANPNSEAADVTITAWPTDGGDAVMAETTSVAARTNVVEQIDTLLPGISGGYIVINSDKSLGAAIAMLGSNFQTLDIVSAAASGTTLTFPALVTGAGDFATSIILVNNTDTDATVAITANQAGAVLATSSVTTVPSKSNIVRTLGELFPDATFTNIGFDANVVVTSDQPLSGAATIGSSSVGLLATGMANAR